MLITRRKDAARPPLASVSSRGPFRKVQAINSAARRKTRAIFAQSISRIDHQTPVTPVVITIRSYYLPRMPGVPSADLACRTARIPGTEKNHAVEHSAALSRRAHRACTLACLVPFFLSFFLRVLPPLPLFFFLYTLVIIKESVPPSI